MLDGIPLPERFAPLPPVPTEPMVAAVAPAGSAPPEDSLGDAEDEPAAAAEPAPPSAAATSTGPATPAAPPPTKPGGSSVYLSDKELLEAQSATDDGEVEE